MKFEKITMGELEKQCGGFDELVKKGYIFYFCKNCECMIVDDRKIKMVDIKNCLKCEKPLK